MEAQKKRAFMVGISHYDTALTDYEWNDIHGKEDVQLIAPMLKKQGYVVTEVLDGKATYKNIISGFQQFIKSCEKGDIVYVHFSCHGQPVEDKDKDETDGWDEALVPIDAYKNYHKGRYEGKKHLLDDQLNQYTSQIRNKIGKTGFLYVVIDACHAGTSARGDEQVRGTRLGFTSSGKIYNPPADKKRNFKLTSSSGMSNVIFVEACRSDQINREIKIDGACYGALSYNVAQALKQTKLSNSPNTFMNALNQSIKQKGRWPNNQNIVTETSY